MFPRKIDVSSIQSSMEESDEISPKLSLSNSSLQSLNRWIKEGDEKSGNLENSFKTLLSISKEQHINEWVKK